MVTNGNSKIGRIRLAKALMERNHLQNSSPELEAITCHSKISKYPKQSPVGTWKFFSFREISVIKTSQFIMSSGSILNNSSRRRSSWDLIS